jgi:Flp pilus assembly CpaE family ATPase
VLAEAAAVLAHRGEPSRADRMFGDPATSMAVPPGAGEQLADAAPSRRGSVIAVWGPTGAPGRTTVAITLADELARLGRATLLVDADVYGGTVAAELGLLDESPGLAAACRLAAGTKLSGGALAGLCWQLSAELRVLTGIPIAARWTELRAAAMAPVLAAARQLADVTVVDCGFCLETDEELSFDSLAPRRNGATLAVLDDADEVLVIGAADPVGMQRLVRGLSELRDAEVAATSQVVLNKVRRGVVPGDVRAELVGALELFSGVTPLALLPYDRESLDAALATGRSLREARPASALRKAICELAGHVVADPAHADHPAAMRRPRKRSGKIRGNPQGR